MQDQTHPSAIVDVHRDAVDMAPSAGGEEVAHPLHSHRTTTVGDGWRDELGLAGERFHRELPDPRRLGRVDVGLRIEVGLVKAMKRGETCTKRAHGQQAEAGRQKQLGAGWLTQGDTLRRRQWQLAQRLPIRQCLNPSCKCAKRMS